VHTLGLLSGLCFLAIIKFGSVSFSIRYLSSGCSRMGPTNPACCQPWVAGWVGLSLINFRATLDEGSRSSVQWNRAILLDERHKLDPWPLNRGVKDQKSGKSTKVAKVAKNGELMIWRTKMQAKVQGRVEL